MGDYSQDTGAGLSTTLPEAEERAATLTKIRRGYWSNRWWCSYYGHREATGMRQPPGEYIGEFRWPSREVAEEKAAMQQRKFRDRVEAGELRYLGPVFFPEQDQ